MIFFMLAIFEHGLQQYKCNIGSKLKLDKLRQKEGETVEFKQVLLVQDKDTLEIGQPFVKYVVITKILSHNKDKKVRVVKHKSKKRYNVLRGHRQEYTELEVLEIKKVS